MNISQNQNIQLLPEHIIDQIKAGEVIERTSTLLKEIIENSIDAHSTKIEIHLIDNGLDLISIIDDGRGIKSEDLPLAFCRHATSKIESFEDIYKLHSFGFRGEALASIASISKVTCVSQTKEALGTIKIEGGKELFHKVEPSPSKKTGTKFYIKDLFYNTPVRMKFIQSKTSEKNQLKKMFNSFLLTHPEITFSIKWDDNEKDFYPTKENLADRIKDVLFPKKNIKFLLAENSYDGAHFKVFLTCQSTRGNAHKSHFLFINERFVQDIQLHRIILNSAAKLWNEGESGHYIAFLSIPTDELDVNIHPNKTIVKLFQPPKVFSMVSATIKHSLEDHILSKEDSSPLPQELSDLEPIENPLSLEATDIEYKKIDFNHEEGVSHYLDNLHSQELASKDLLSLPSFFHFDELSLLLLNETPYVLNKEKLLIYELHQIISTNTLSEDMIPLLVSKPIKLSQKFSWEQRQFFLEMGFEVDQLDQSTVVIRAFPKSLQRFPYFKIAQFFIKNSYTQISQIDLSSFEFGHITDDFISSLLKKHTTSDLINQGVLLRVLKSHLLNIYDKK